MWVLACVFCRGAGAGGRLRFWLVSTTEFTFHHVIYYDKGTFMLGQIHGQRELAIC